MGVDDPHDNPSILIDPEGYIWVFVSGRGTRRPGFKYRSKKPYDISAFEQITEEEMTYPQPWYIEGSGFFHFFYQIYWRTGNCILRPVKMVKTGQQIRSLQGL